LHSSSVIVFILSDFLLLIFFNYIYYFELKHGRIPIENVSFCSIYCNNILYSIIRCSVNKIFYSYYTLDKIKIVVFQLVLTRRLHPIIPLIRTYKDKILYTVILCNIMHNIEYTFLHVPDKTRKYNKHYIA